MATPTFTEALEQAELLARQALPPELHERLSCAVALVHAGSVFQADDGTWTVQSATDPAQTYTHVNGVCGCDDMRFNRPTLGLCKHRLSVYLARKTMALMSQAPQAPVAVPLAPCPDNDREGSQSPPGLTATAPAPLPEAPVSITLKASVHGFETLVTLRGVDFASVQAQVEQAAAWLKTQAPAPRQDGGWCPIHNVPLKTTTKNGRSWKSHKTQDGWCQGQGGGR